MNYLIRILVLAGFVFFAAEQTNAQINNSGFEENQGDKNTHCPNNSGEISFGPFNKGKVNYWNASHGSPQLYTKDHVDGCDGNINDAKEGNWCAYLSYATDNCEGIFQNLNLEKDEIINLAISARGFSSNSKLIIKLKNGLGNESTGAAFSTSSLNNLINSNNEQLLLNQNLTTEWVTYYITNVTVQQAFSQIWIYSDGNSLKLDQFYVNVSCCKLKEEYQNIINPPSTFRNNYIKAGEMIDPNRIQGKVIINNQNTTIFQARNKIILEPGFEVINNSNFIAQIDLCVNLSTSIEIEQRKSTCEHEYIARVCNGSGFYSFQWNLNGMEVIDESTTDYRVKFKPKSNGTVTVTVTDLADNTQTSATVNLGYVPFTGNFPLDSFITTNVFTPNGDGINDVWIIGDAAKPNTNVFAYDAYTIDLEIQDRDEIVVFRKGESDKKVTGFADKYVLWDGGSDPINGTVYTIAEFKNCYNSITINQAVMILGTDGFPPPPNNDSLNLEDARNLKISSKDSVPKDTDFLVFPNPANSYLYIAYKGLDMKFINISIADATGKIIRKEQINNNTSGFQFNLSDLNSGLYFVIIEYENKVQIRKFIKE